MARLPAVAVGLGALVCAFHAEAARIRNGPYLLDVGTDRATVVFELGESASASVEVSEPDGGTRTFESRPRTLHRIVVSGLEPDTAYPYRVTTDGARGAEGRITTAPPAGEPARFFVYGDVRSGHREHAAIVRGILAERPTLLLHTGDYVGDGADDEDWERFFEVSRRLLRRACLAPTMGNHDGYDEDGTANYRRYLAFASGRRGAREDAVLRWGDTGFLLVSSNNDGFPAAQRRYFERALAEWEDDPTLRHRVVAVHDGPFSSGRHGGNEEMARDGFVDFLREGRITVVFSGHDHDYERGVAAGVPYVVTGGGGAPLYGVNRREPFQDRFEAVHHYVRVESEGDVLRVTPVRSDGSKIEECSLEAGAWACRGGTPARSAVQERTPGWLEITAAGAILVLGGVLGARAIRRRRKVLRARDPV